MAPFVLLALALAAVAVGAVVVGVRQLLTGVRKLRGAVQAGNDRFAPLLAELQAEVAVSSTEVEVLQERVAALQAGRGRAANQMEVSGRTVD